MASHRPQAISTTVLVSASILATNSHFLNDVPKQVGRLLATRPGLAITLTGLGLLGCVNAVETDAFARYLE